MRMERTAPATRCCLLRPKCQTARQVEAPPGHPFGDRVALALEQPQAAKHRLLVHRPEERPSADLQRCRGAASPRGVEGHARPRAPRRRPSRCSPHTSVAASGSCNPAIRPGARRIARPWPACARPTPSSRSSCATPRAACRLVMRRFQPSSSWTKRRSGWKHRLRSDAAALGEPLVVGDDHATFAGGDVLVGVEAESAEVAKAAAGPAAVGLPVHLGGILDDRRARAAGPAPAPGPYRPASHRYARP